MPAKNGSRHETDDVGGRDALAAPQLAASGLRPRIHAARVQMMAETRDSKPRARRPGY